MTLARIGIAGLVPFTLLAGCASSPPPPAPDLMASTPTLEVEAADATFATGASLLSGWDLGSEPPPVAADAPVPPGHRLLLGIHVESGSDSTTRYVLYESLDATGAEQDLWMSPSLFGDEQYVFSSGSSRLRLTLFDRDLSLMRELLKAPPSLLLRAGLAPLNRLVLLDQANQPRDPSLERAATLSLLALIEFGEFVGETRQLRAPMVSVLSLPPVLTLVFGERRLGITVIADQVVPPLPLIWGGVAFESADLIPLRLTINDHTTLFARVIAVEPVGPLAMTGGVLEMRASHPTEPDRTLVMRVLAVDAADQPAEQPTDLN